MAERELQLLKGVANEIEVPGECLVVVISEGNKALRNKMEKIHGSRIL